MNTFSENNPVLAFQSQESLTPESAPVRIATLGSVPYLNAAPLTRGLEEQIKFAVPSELANCIDWVLVDIAHNLILTYAAK